MTKCMSSTELTINYPKVIKELRNSNSVTTGPHRAPPRKVNSMNMKKLSAFLLCAAFALFVTASNLTAQQPVNLGTAGNYVILTKTGISTTVGTSITGDIGVSPCAASCITGFGLILDGSGTFSTSPMVNGKVYAADYANPTPANLGTAVLNMQAAYTDAAGRPAGVGPNLNMGA